MTHFFPLFSAGCLFSLINRPTVLKSIVVILECKEFIRNKTGREWSMSTTVLLALLACLLIAAKFAGWVCHRLHIPAVLGQLLVGVIVGPSLLGWVQINGTLDSFANLGVIILMFIAGMETDMQQMRKVGGAAFVSALMVVICPFIVGTVFALALHYSLPVSLFLGTLLTATSVSISAETLKDLKQLTSKEGTTILGAAVIDDVLGLIVLSIILAFTLGQNPTWAILKMVLYFPLAYVLGYFGFPLLSRWLPKVLALEARIGLIFALVLLYAWSAQELGSVAAITGAYMAGILVSRTEMREWVHDGLSTMGYSFFVPWRCWAVLSWPSAGSGSILAARWVLLVTARCALA